MHLRKAQIFLASLTAGDTSQENTKYVKFLLALLKHKERFNTSPLKSLPEKKDLTDQLYEVNIEAVRHMTRRKRLDSVTVKVLEIIDENQEAVTGQFLKMIAKRVNDELGQQQFDAAEDIFAEWEEEVSKKREGPVGATKLTPSVHIVVTKADLPYIMMRLSCPLLDLSDDFSGKAWYKSLKLWVN